MIKLRLETCSRICIRSSTMSLQTLTKIDELILNVLSTEDHNVNISDTIEWEKECNYNASAGDNTYWLKQLSLQVPLYKPRIVSYNNTFIIIGSDKNDNCYIYNTDNNQLELIKLENEFPSSIVCDKQGNTNTHKILDVNIGNTNDKNKKKYLMFGYNYSNEKYNDLDACYMVECTYNCDTNSIQFMDVTENFNTKYLSSITTANKPFKLNSVPQIVIFDGEHITIYDYSKDNFKRYHPHKYEDISEDTYMEGIVQKNASNNNDIYEFIIWGNVSCYQCVLSNNDENNDVNKYIFDFKKLSYIQENVEWQFFSYVIYNNFVICFGGSIQENNEVNTICSIFMYEIDKDSWHKSDNVILPNKTFHTEAFLNTDKHQLVAHIIGGMKTIGYSQADDCIYNSDDTNHWRLYLDYTSYAKQQICDILQAQLFTHQISQIIIRFLDFGGFMSSLILLQ
eukprot:476892_1